MRRISFCLAMAAASCLLTAAASAQTRDAKDKSAPRPAPAAPVAATPERTTASFGDWIVRCETGAAGGRRNCEVAQIITLQGQANPIAQIALGKPAPGDAMRLTLVLPANISIPARPQVVSAKPDGARPEMAKPMGPKVELVWQSCTAIGCFASSDVSSEMIASFGGQTEPGYILFKDSAARDLALPLSFKGLAQAIAALAKEP